MRSDVMWKGREKGRVLGVGLLHYLRSFAWWLNESGF